MDNINAISHRMIAIESLLLGQEYVKTTTISPIASSSSSSNSNSHLNVIDRIDQIAKQMNSIDSQLPILIQCRDLASKLRPYILQGNSYINLYQSLSS
jgi:trehalose-6-phosphate synthase